MRKTLFHYYLPHLLFASGSSAADDYADRHCFPVPRGRAANSFGVTSQRRVPSLRRRSLQSPRDLHGQVSASFNRKFIIAQNDRTIIFVVKTIQCTSRRAHRRQCFSRRSRIPINIPEIVFSHRFTYDVPVRRIFADFVCGRLF